MSPCYKTMISAYEWAEEMDRRREKRNSLHWEFDSDTREYFHNFGMGAKEIEAGRIAAFWDSYEESGTIHKGYAYTEAPINMALDPFMDLVSAMERKPEDYSIKCGLLSHVTKGYLNPETGKWQKEIPPAELFECEGYMVSTPWDV